MSGTTYTPDAQEITCGQLRIDSGTFGRELTGREVARGLARIRAEAIREAARELAVKARRVTDDARRDSMHICVESLLSHADHVDEATDHP